MTTTKGNKLIAEFMGYKIWTWDNKKYYITMGKSPNDRNYDVENLKFNYDWNWLMPVVEKIESIKVGNIKYIDFHIMPDAVIVTNQEDEENPLILINKSECKGSIETEFTFFETKIQAVYQAVLKFIKWYNDQQK